MQPAETSSEAKRDAVAYVEAVVARAEGHRPPEAEAASERRPAARLVPAFLKRALVRLLITLNRHPFDHLSHPMRVELEHQLAELRASVHAANRRADAAYDALQRARPELETWRRAVEASLRELDEDMRALRSRLDELDSAR